MAAKKKSSPAKKSSKSRDKKEKRVAHVKIETGTKTKSDGPKKGYGVFAPGGVNLKMRSEASSDAGNVRQGGLMSGTANNRLRPRIEFWKRQQFYLTIGRAQNVTESYVLNILNREWYYDAGKPEEVESDFVKAGVEAMETWEENVVVTKFMGSLIRNWIINGLHIISPKDWVPMQLQSLESKDRDKSGHTLNFYQRIDGVERKIPAKDFLEIPFIEWDREPWPVGMFDSLMNNDYLDIDGKDPISSFELYRQALQDNMKIHHKFASPRVIYTADGVGKEVLEDDIVPVLEGMANGDRAAFNAAIDIKQETVDGNARFIEHVNKIIDEIDTGLQSSANRLITEPSAMADAREANLQDDNRVLGLMERIRVLFNKEIIPRVTGLEPGKVVLKWGAKDAFDLEFPEPLEKAIAAGLPWPKAQLMLEEQYHWKVPTDEEVIAKFGSDALKPPEPEQPQQDAKKVVEEAYEKLEKDLKAKFEAFPGIESEIDKKLKNEKLVLVQYLNEIAKDLRS
jgi:hypothetical protein